MTEQTAHAKIIVVTGASSGFGEQIAKALALAGHRVFGTSRNHKPDADGVRMVRLDVTDDASVAACIALVMAEAGRIDVLVNNAGIGICGAIEDTSLAEAQAQLDTNFWGAVRLIQGILPIMRNQRSGRIVTIGSLAGHAALPYQAFYSASKFALEGLNEALRLELTGTGIDATIICPGDFRTGFTAARRVAEKAAGSFYAGKMERTVKIYERDELNGADPAQVARLVVTIVRAGKVRVRYSVGKFEQRFGILLKRWLPPEWFELIMQSTYQL